MVPFHILANHFLVPYQYQCAILVISCVAVAGNAVVWQWLCWELPQGNKLVL